MRHGVAFVVAVVLAICACSKDARDTTPVRPATPPEVLTAARGTIEQWRQAYQVKGMDALARLYAHEAQIVVVHEGRALVGWASVQSMIEDRLARYQKIVIRLKDITVSALGPSAATATATMTRELGDEVTSVTESGVLTMVLRRDGDQWVIVTEHYSYRRGT